MFTSRDLRKVFVAQSCSTLSGPMDYSQGPLSMESSRQEYWSGLPCPSPGDLPNSGIEPRSPALQADCLIAELPRKNSFNSYQYKLGDQRGKY